MRTSLKRLVQRAVQEIFTQAQKKIDCVDWGKEEVRDYVLQIGDFCQKLADAFFNDGINGHAFRTIDPEVTLHQYANYFSKLLKICLEKSSV